MSTVAEIEKDVERRMQGAVDVLHAEFKTLRTGRANVAVLDSVTVDYYGTPTPLSQVANLTVPESSLIVAQPWDKGMIAPIEKAIRNSDLGLNPSSDGKIIRIPVPPLTEDRRRELVKKAHAMAEDARTAVRQVRRDGNDKLKKLEKEHEISQDEEKRALDVIQKLTDRHIEQINDTLKHKEEDILKV